MGLSDPRVIYGIHSISPYNRRSKKPYGMLKVIGQADLSLTSELNELYAGSNKFPWAAESKIIKTDFKAKVKAYPDFLFSLFLGASVVSNGPDAAGSVTALENGTGVSFTDPADGVAVAVVALSKADLKFGKYVLEAIDSTHVKLYGYTDIDNARGAGVSFQDDDLVLIATVDLSGASPYALPDFGLELSKNGVSVALVAGDTAKFEVLPPSSKTTIISVGASTTSLPAFGAILMAQKRATDELFEIEAFNMIGSGLPINLQEQAWSEPEMKMSALYDAAHDKVFEIRDYLA